MSRPYLKKLILGGVGLAISVFSVPSHAALMSIAVVPTSWRLQNYMSNNVTVYFTGVTICGGPSQGLTFDTAATNEDKNRFWALVMTAKAANKQIFVYYESANCVISSFGMLENG